MWPRGLFFPVCSATGAEQRAPLMVTNTTLLLLSSRKANYQQFVWQSCFAREAKYCPCVQLSLGVNQSMTGFVREPDRHSSQHLLSLTDILCDMEPSACWFHHWATVLIHPSCDHPMAINPSHDHGQDASLSCPKAANGPNPLTTTLVRSRGMLRLCCNLMFALVLLPRQGSFFAHHDK